MLNRYSIIIYICCGFYFGVVSSTCTKVIHGIYCTSIGKNFNQTINIKDTFENNSNISSIYLNNVTGIIGDNTLKSFSNLKHLEIQLSSINNFTAKLNYLEELYLIKNFRFPNITSEFFVKCPNLINLIIVDNADFNIFEGAFEQTKNIKQLTINNQNITILKGDLLRGLNELTFLDLSSNSIEKLEENVFQNLTNLNNLVLRNNKINNFYENTFKVLKNLRSLDLLNVNVTLDQATFKHLKQLSYIGLPTKTISEDFTIKNLTTLFNNLETIALLATDQNREVVKKFIKSCKSGGFNIQLI